MAGTLGFELKEFDATSLDGTYQNLGSALASPARKVLFFNTSDVDAYISNDGSSNIIRIPSGKDVKIDSYDKHNDLNEAAFVFKSGTQLTVSQVTGAGLSGNIIAHIFT